MTWAFSLQQCTCWQSDALLPQAHQHHHLTATSYVWLPADCCLGALHQEWRSVGAAAPKGTWAQEPAPGGVLGDMAQLQQWARTSAADLALAEALLGSPLELDQSLGDLLPVLVGSDVHGQPMLVW